MHMKQKETKYIGSEWQRRQTITKREARLAPIGEERTRENIGRISDREIDIELEHECVHLKLKRRMQLIEQWVAEILIVKCQA